MVYPFAEKQLTPEILAQINTQTAVFEAEAEQQGIRPTISTCWQNWNQNICKHNLRVKSPECYKEPQLNCCGFFYDKKLFQRAGSLAKIAVFEGNLVLW